MVEAVLELSFNLPFASTPSAIAALLKYRLWHTLRVARAVASASASYDMIGLFTNHERLRLRPVTNARAVVPCRAQPHPNRTGMLW